MVACVSTSASSSTRRSEFVRSSTALLPEGFRICSPFVPSNPCVRRKILQDSLLAIPAQPRIFVPGMLSKLAHRLIQEAAPPGADRKVLHCHPEDVVGHDSGTILNPIQIVVDDGRISVFGIRGQYSVEGAGNACQITYEPRRHGYAFVLGG